MKSWWLCETEPKSCNVCVLRRREHALLSKGRRCFSFSQRFITWNKVQLRTSPRNCGNGGFLVFCKTVIGNIGLPSSGTRLFSFLIPWNDCVVCSSAVVAELWGYFSTDCGTSECAYTVFSCCGLQRWLSTVLVLLSVEIHMGEGCRWHSVWTPTVVGILAGVYFTIEDVRLFFF